MTALPPSLLLIGPDRYRQRQRLAAVILQADADALDRASFDAEDERWLAACREPAVRSRRRVVVVERAERLSEAAVAWLEASGEQVAHTAVLILVADAEPEAKRPAARLAKRIPTERFGWLGPEELAAWIQARAEAAGKRIAPPAVQELIHALGPDLAGLERLLEQLTVWLGDRPQISQADCREFLAGRPRSGAMAARDRSPFALVEHIGRRQTAAALGAASDQLAAGKDVLEVLGMIAWQLQRWVQVARLQQQGLSKPRIEALSGIKAWQLERIQAELAGRPIAWLGRMLERCRRLDVDLKTGRALARPGLELLIVELCR
jgi:DNA polymerase-3 subunit delta